MKHKTITIVDESFWKKFNVAHAEHQSPSIKTKGDFVMHIFDVYMKNAERKKEVEKDLIETLIET